MSATAAHPRRRPARDSDPSMTLIESFQNMSIRKGDTFHPSRTGADNTAFWDPLESRVRSPIPPIRSSTSPQSLEELLIGAGERRIVQLLNRVEQAIAANSKTALSKVLSEPEMLPLSASTVDRTQVSNDHLETGNQLHSHLSDSGIGTSIADSLDLASNRPGKPLAQMATTESSPRLSLAKITVAAHEKERGLSKYAAEQIHEHIVKPILCEESLKGFHDLIKSVPTRIGNKEIKNLRDLEKTLIFLAPDHSLSPSEYLHFCERTIRVLHSTVTTLHESDQRAPADRPYTQGYFFDLVEQIRRYATILAATRTRRGGNEDDFDETTTNTEEISITAGLSQTGKPAELVRHTADGKAVSLANDREISTDELGKPQTKRVAETGMDTDEALRSMARRKKNAPPEIHPCSICDKQFKRPCDLTKHVKTHERPWKCPTTDCKYHEYGWPTEKERDRHVNDKHSPAPALFQCLFPPCPYTSKRESNCKQHMEKAHSWRYLRSKSNGKGRPKSNNKGNVRCLQQTSVPPSPAASMLTPNTPAAPSPSTNSLYEPSRYGSMAPPPVVGPSNAYNTPTYDFASHFNMEIMGFDFNDLANFPENSFPITPATSEERRCSTSLSSRSELQYDHSNFDDGSPRDYNFDHFNWNDFNFPTFTPHANAAPPSSSAPYTSPAVHMDQMFTSDAMEIEENDIKLTSHPREDFTLFSSTGAAVTDGVLFPSLRTEGNRVNLGPYIGTPLEMTNCPALMPSNSSTLDELFPELRNQR